MNLMTFNIFTPHEQTQRKSLMDGQIGPVSAESAAKEKEHLFMRVGCSKNI
jgi:hypothetical protein